MYIPEHSVQPGRLAYEPALQHKSVVWRTVKHQCDEVLCVGGQRILTTMANYQPSNGPGFIKINLVQGIAVPIFLGQRFRQYGQPDVSPHQIGYRVETADEHTVIAARVRAPDECF